MLFSITFTIIFLTINHLYSTLASPIVSNGGVAGESYNLTHSLANYVPTDQLCDQPSQWLRRVCRSGISDRSWSDTCFPNANNEYYWKFGTCPENTMCQNALTSDTIPKETIYCAERPAQNLQPAADKQIGVFRISNGNGAVPKSYTVTVDLETNLADASVNALIEGTPGNYLVTPHEPITGSLIGTTTQVCSYNETNQDCVPEGLHAFVAGDAILFKLGLDRGQIVNFYYGIVSAVKPPS